MKRYLLSTTAISTMLYNVRTKDETQSQPDVETQFQPDVEPLLQSPLQQQVRSSLQSVPSSSLAGPSSTPVYSRPNKAKKKGSLDIDEAQNKIPQTLDTEPNVKR
ncbi:hypothetical protein EVAR_40340_1 [Eumeta japonica]|uniref:Uncharacterized protein n=1 Tax=Eumeta variegata TaxID=151549 RepID=A0A4C1YDW9_EUMVA|nr:hypothetical protein EVAR_40340_1 [Eumeta japonica]